jgi:hypothetical protein
MEANYTFATMVCLVLVLHHGFESLKRTFITLMSKAVKQSKEAFICPQKSLKGAKTLYICQYGCEKQSKQVYILNHDITASFTLNSDPELPISDLALSVYGIRKHSHAHRHH